MDDKSESILAEMSAEMKQHLCQKLLPFWYRRTDKVNGGFKGYMSFDLKDDDEAIKGGILNSRILWFFSETGVVYRKGLISDNDLSKGGLDSHAIRSAADQAYEFLKNTMWDKDAGGLFWSVTYDGAPSDTTKHTYNQAFGIYGLAAYFELTGNTEALNIAFRLERVIEEKCRDESGYGEAYARYFNPVSNDKLSENGVMAAKTMNTLLHVYEGYAGLLKVMTNRPEYKADAERISNNMMGILHIFMDKIYNKKLHRQEVFFDRDWNSLIDLWSYGHDIESSWLFDKGLDILQGSKCTNSEQKTFFTECRAAFRDLELTLREHVFDGHSLAAECENGVVKENRVWWVQAETVNGFLWNGLKYNDRTDIACAMSEWDYIKKYIMDRREGSEWFWELNKDGSPVTNRPLVEEWKCPYHNGRMVLLTLELVEKNRK